MNLIKKDNYGDFCGFTKKGVVMLIVLPIIIIILLITLLCSFKTIKSGEVGLRVRFGKIVDSSLTEGINFKIPYIEKIAKVNIKVQKSELEVEGSTKDLQIVNTDVAVNYRVDSKKASELYRTVGNNYGDVILMPAIKESIKTAIAQYTAEEITINRGEVSIKCLEAIQSKVEKYGIFVEDFNLTDFSFSEEYTRAIEEKQVAEQKVQTAKQNLEKSKVEAEQKVVEAEAQADANKKIVSTLTEDVLIQKFIEKWDGKLPETYAGEDIMTIFNLTKGEK